MKAQFSTNDVHPSQRFDYWREVVCREALHHDAHPECRRTFQATIEIGVLADCKLFLFEHSPVCVTRTAQQVATATDDDLFLCRQVAGAFAMEQLGHEVLMENGDVMLLDPLLPYTGKFQSRSKLLSLNIPRSAVQARLGATRDLVACTVKPTGEGGIMSSYLMALSDHADWLASSSARLVLDQIFDLLAVSVAKAMRTKTPKASSAASLALMKIRMAVESRLSDPTLDDDTVAAAAGISVRYANSLLAMEGMSIMRLVRAQ